MIVGSMEPHKVLVQSSESSFPTGFADGTAVWRLIGDSLAPPEVNCCRSDTLSQQSLPIPPVQTSVDITQCVYHHCITIWLHPRCAHNSRQLSVSPVEGLEIISLKPYSASPFRGRLSDRRLNGTYSLQCSY
jgi:hypothetical protein